MARFAGAAHDLLSPSWADNLAIQGLGNEAEQFALSNMGRAQGVVTGAKAAANIIGAENMGKAQVAAAKAGGQAGLANTISQGAQGFADAMGSPFGGNSTPAAPSGVDFSTPIWGQTQSSFKDYFNAGGF